MKEDIQKKDTKTYKKERIWKKDTKRGYKRRIWKKDKKKGYKRQIQNRNSKYKQAVLKRNAKINTIGSKLNKLPFENKEGTDNNGSDTERNRMK